MASPDISGDEDVLGVSPNVDMNGETAEGYEVAELALSSQVPNIGSQEEEEAKKKGGKSNWSRKRNREIANMVGELGGGEMSEDSLEPLNESELAELARSSQESAGGSQEEVVVKKGGRSKWAMAKNRKMGEMEKELGTRELSPPPIRVVLVKKSRKHHMMEYYIRYCYNMQKLSDGTGMYVQLGKTSNSAILEGEWFAQFQLRSWQQVEHSEKHDDILKRVKIPAYRVYLGVHAAVENRISPNCYPKDLGDDAAFMKAFPTGIIVDYRQVTLLVETGCGGTYLKFHEQNDPLPVKAVRMGPASKERNIHFVDYRHVK